MKLLYAIQGTGNGHLTRAREMVPELRKLAQVDVLLSGLHCEVHADFDIQYRLQGYGFVFGKKGGVDLFSSYAKNKFNRFVREIRQFPINQYDLVISDFEPVSAWASRIAGIPCYGLSNQCTLLDPEVPKPEAEDVISKLILSYYAPVSRSFGYHYKSYNSRIYTPIIRREIRELTPQKDNFYVVYLPFYSDERILKWLGRLDNVNWKVFSKHSLSAYTKGNVSFYPIEAQLFLESFANCEGVLSSASFGITSEALYLGKKLLVIPMKGQYEQLCNAHALREMGVNSVKSLREKWLPGIMSWIAEREVPTVEYPDNSRAIAQSLLTAFLEDHETSQFDSGLTRITDLVVDVAGH